MGQGEVDGGGARFLEVLREFTSQGTACRWGVISCIISIINPLFLPPLQEFSIFFCIEFGTTFIPSLPAKPHTHQRHLSPSPPSLQNNARRNIPLRFSDRIWDHERFSPLSTLPPTLAPSTQLTELRDLHLQADDNRDAVEAVTGGVSFP